jgi:endonuclease/exonuclease/phosphatase (EEP) superfamily protein YafD
MMVKIRQSDWIRDYFRLLAAMGLVIILCFSAQAQSLCVATYNLNYGNRRGDQVLDAISKASPDLICFQESTTQSEQFLRDRLAKTYPFFHSVGHEGKYYAERFAFACKTKLSDVEFVPPTQGLFGFYLATLEVGRDARVPNSEIGRDARVPSQKIQIVNVHLTPFHGNLKDGILGATSALASTEKTHAVEIDAILKRVDPKRPTIILGDFNSMSSFVAPKRLKEQGFKDAFAELNTKPESHPTWTWPTKPIPISLRIDYVFHTDHLIAKKSEVVRREGSDHFLLFAEFDLASKEDKEEAARP